MALLLIGAAACAKAENSKRDGLPVRNTDHYAILDTDRGTIVLELYPAVAPKTVANFEKLSKDGFYSLPSSRIPKKWQPFTVNGIRKS